MSRGSGGAVLTLAMWVACVSLLHAEELIDDGSEARLTGAIVREQVEDVEQGVATNAVIWVLHLDAPFTLRSEGFEDSTQQFLTPHVGRVQLVLSPEQYTQYRDLTSNGTHVAVHGSVFQGINAHHHTPALIEVKRITRHQSPSPP